MILRQNSHSFNISPSKILNTNKKKSPHKAHKQQQFLKTSQNFNYNKYHKSIQSIHLNRSSNQDYLHYKERCPLGILKQSKHLNLHHQKSEHSLNKQKIKQKAYKWFNEQKNKQRQTQKLERYLLPKIMRLNKNSNIHTLNRNVDNKERSIDPKHSIKKVSQLNRRNLVTKPDQVYQQVSIFKQKCINQLNNIELPLPLQAKKRQYYFDSSLNQVIQQKQKQNSHMDQSLQVYTKFKALRIEKQIPLKQNELVKIPKFLVQRLTIESSLGQASLPKQYAVGNSSPLSKNSHNSPNKKYYQQIR